MKKLTFLLIIIYLLLGPLQLHAQEDFCSNLPKILDQVGFTESFKDIRGDLISSSTEAHGNETTVTNIYKPTQDLIPGVPAKIIHKDYPGTFDIWTYRIDYSASNSLGSQRTMAEYWSKTMKECVAEEEGWDFRIEERKYDSEEKMMQWVHTIKMDGYLGLRVKNFRVILFQEKDNSFRNTGRYGVRLEIF